MKINRGNTVYLILIMASIVVAAAVTFFCTKQSMAYEAALAVQRQQVAAMENELLIQQAYADSLNNQAVQSVTGLDAERFSRDMEIMREFIEKCVTWSSVEEYKAVREEIKQAYRLEDSSAFMRTFLPPYTSLAYNDSVGRIFISNNDAIKVYVTGISADKYTYFSVVTCTSANLGGASGDFDVIFIYTIDGDGALSGIEAYTLG